MNRPSDEGVTAVVAEILLLACLVPTALMFVLAEGEAERAHEAMIEAGEDRWCSADVSRCQPDEAGQVRACRNVLDGKAEVLVCRLKSIAREPEVLVHEELLKEAEA